MHFSKIIVFMPEDTSKGKIRSDASYFSLIFSVTRMVIFSIAHLLFQSALKQMSVICRVISRFHWQLLHFFRKLLMEAQLLAGAFVLATSQQKSFQEQSLETQITPRAFNANERSVKTSTSRKLIGSEIWALTISYSSTVHRLML